MKTSEKYLEEIPNLSYIKSLAKGDFEFQRNFITTLREEYAIDSLGYSNHIEMNEPRAASEIVNKLKYTFGFLSMSEAYHFAEQHQEKLRAGNTILTVQFKKILVIVHKFLSEI